MTDYAIVIIDDEGEDVNDDPILFTDSMKNNPTELLDVINKVIKKHEENKSKDSEAESQDDDDDDDDDLGD